MKLLRIVRPALLLALLISALMPIAGPAALADSLTEDFELFNAGSPNGQSGWVATGSAGAGCATYDHAIAASGVAGFGSKSLRISNAVTSGCFTDQTYSESISEEAGEASAASDGFSTGPRQNHFEAEWDFASAVPGAEQPGLSVVASPDRGDGARMSWVQMTDTASGLAVNLNDYRDEHVVGVGLGDPNGRTAPDNFFLTNVVSGLDRTTVHTIKVSIDFLTGERNDVVRVWVDGTLRHVDTSWEDYFRFSEGNPTRTVDSILFRTAGTAAPATAGQGFFIDNLTIASGPTSIADSTGSWELYPAQSVTTSTSTVTSTVYQAKVRAPINADGTSNFPKKRGVIPVQFDLESAVKTVATETTTTGPVLFQSILSNNPAVTEDDFSFLSFTPSADVLFADVNELVANYAYTTGDCGGGSLRWSLQIDTDGDGDSNGSLWLYYGDVPEFTDCTGAESQSGFNMIGRSDARYDITAFGGPFYGTYADSLALVGDGTVLRASLVVDGGWKNGDDIITLTSASVDGADWTPAPVGTVVTGTTTTTTPFAKTCALPQAKLHWTQVDATPDGAINEAESVQPKDTGVYYRNVDCKYIYNLDVTSLNGAGTYFIWVNIDGTYVPSPAKFDLR